MYSDFLKDSMVFIKVIKGGSITALSNKSGEHRTTISKRISRIEEYFATQLIQMYKGKIKLTKEGHDIFFDLMRIVDNLNISVSQLSKKADHLKHTIKFLNSADVHMSFGTDFFSKLLNDHPSLSIESRIYTQYQLNRFGIALKSAIIDYDVVVLWDDFFYLINEYDWLVKKRFSNRKYIYASLEYIQDNPNIYNIVDISKHPCIVNNYEESTSWNVQDKSGNKHKIDVNVRAIVDTYNLQLKLLENGLGIGILPVSVVLASKTNLQHIFTDLSLKERDSSLLIKKTSLNNNHLLKKITLDMDIAIDNLNFWK